MMVLITAPTKAELDAVAEWPGAIRAQTGVGMLETALNLADLLQRYEPVLAFQFGICGSFRDDLSIGTAVHVCKEQYGDLGAETRTGFDSAYDLKLLQPDAAPFIQGTLSATGISGRKIDLPKVHGITVNRVHGSAASISACVERWHPDVESMEGLAFALACARKQVEWIEIRSISNLVEPRNRANWDIPAALRSLHQASAQIFRDLV